MTAGEYLELEGNCGRTCPECGVTITVVRPPRPISSQTGARARKHFGAELKRQVLWELTCSSCRRWWNTAIQRCEEGLTTKRTSA